MKTVNKILRILVIVFGAVSFFLFFTDFANFVLGDSGSKSLVAAQLAFGSKVTIAGTEYDMAKSADILFCFLVTAFAFVLSALSFKSKKIRYAVPALGIISSVYMLVIKLHNPWKFIDTRPIDINSITELTHTPFAWALVIALFVFTILAVAHLLLDDYIEVLESNGEKLTIFKRVVRFFRDYKSEVKKIVWPGIKDVVKNTIIVLIVCLLVGALIWAVDFGLGKLLGLLWKL